VSAKRDRQRTLAAAALLGFAVVYFQSALRLDRGTSSNPGPGLVPAAIGGLLLACTAIHLIGVLRSRSGEVEGAASIPPAAGNRRAVVGILAATVVFPLILEPLKFVVATTVVAFVMLVLLNPRRPAFSLGLAVGMAVASFVIFSRLLGVALPGGPVEHLLLRIG
jgi:putative tricarboxylic transport membrane protein